MKIPAEDWKAVKEFVERGRGYIAEEKWVEAEKAARDALALDENHAPTFDLIADIFEGMGKGRDAEEWRAKGVLVRKQAWQRQVEAEARGHHDLLGEPGRKEIP